MKKNMGIIDITIRLVIAALIVVLFFMNIIAGIFGIILLAVAGIFVLTGIFGICPLYLLFGISTRGKEKG